MAQQICQRCGKQDEEERMAFCLGCKKWFHRRRECTTALPGLPQYRQCPWCGFFLYEEK